MALAQRVASAQRTVLAHRTSAVRSAAGVEARTIQVRRTATVHEGGGAYSPGLTRAGRTMGRRLPISPLPQS